ncbi:MAG: monofunctional biosynthetic peptidoglycan transglycosylase [Pseudomonadota bacterium]|jgi:monofunctional biosynthetic peptidoglycan transglycosylase
MSPSTLHGVRTEGSRKRSWPLRLARGLLRLAWRSALAFVGASLLVVLLLRWLDPPTSAFMLRARLQSWVDDRPGTLQIRRDWRDLEQIAPSAGLAVVASEDQAFPTHTGFDVAQIRKAMRDAERGRRVRGASTLSQQVAKNLFLWPGRSLLRKGLEAWFTLLIEAIWPKQRILEIYLNSAEFGRGVYGVQAAAKTFFRHDAARLTAAESALLAAVLPNPARLRADRPSAYVQRRRGQILRQMQQLGGPSYLAGILPESVQRTAR